VWIAAAAVLAAALAGVYLASGGGDFETSRPADPCTREQRSTDTDVVAAAERVGLTALDGAACDLGISREKLLLAVAGEEELDVDDDRRNDAFRQGLRTAIDKEQDAGRLGGAQAALLRAGVEFLPVDALLDRFFSR
jgi:hypothetical protein